MWRSGLFLFIGSITAGLFPALLAGCSASGAGTGDDPYDIRLLKGVEWVEGREGFRPELPGYVLESQIGSIALKAAHANPPDRLILLIRTSPAHRPNLEGFTFTTSERTFSTSPFSPSAIVEVRDAASTRVAGSVPLNAYFEFTIEGEFVRVMFLPSATELMREECLVSWVDWYRR
jgi:hypothetical protein